MRLSVTHVRWIKSADCSVEVRKHDPKGKLARWTGLEPATPGVTGRYSNQLSYHRAWRVR
jgi:hypothetical protein